MKIAIDTETGVKQSDGSYQAVLGANKPLLACAVTDQHKKPFLFDLEKEPDSCYNWLLDIIEREGKRTKNVTIIMHNSQYDTIAIMKAHLFDNNVKICGTQPFIVTEKTEHGQGKTIDLLSFFNASLKEIGNMINLPKLEMPLRYWNKTDLHAYIIRDATITLKAFQHLQKSLKELGYEPKRYTTGAKLSYNYFLHSIGKQHHIWIDSEGNERKSRYLDYWYFNGRIHQSKHNDLLNQMCKGGRIEIVTSNKEQLTDVHKADLNSAYPFAAVQMPQPDLLSESELINDPSPEDYEKLLDKIGMVKATLTVPKMHIPYLPIRYNKKTIFPSGVTITGFWTTYEVKKAIQYGYKLQYIHTIITYRELPFNMFKQHMEKLYDLKEKSTGIMKNTVKLLMNSLTGKFKQIDRNSDHRKTTLQDLDSWTKKGYHIKSQVSDNEFIVEKLEEQKFSKTAHPLVYGYITAYARTQLYEQAIKLPPKDVLYFATDSIIFRGKNNISKFDIGKNMGQWKIETPLDGTTFQAFDENWYELGGQLKSSGLNRRNKSNKQAMQDALNAIRTGQTLQTEVMTKIGTAYRTGNLEDLGSFKMKTMHLAKKPKREVVLPTEISEPDPRYQLSKEDLEKIGDENYD